MANYAREANMTNFEDKTLCQAYVTFTWNVVMGTNQTFDIFWEAVRI